MKGILAAVVLLFAGGVVGAELWAYLHRRVSRDPFVNAQRLWRRCGGAAALAAAAILFYFLEAVVDWAPGLTGKAGVVALNVVLALAACYVALKDAAATARIALEQQHALQRQSAEVFRQLRDGASGEQGKAQNPEGNGRRR